MAAAPSSFRRYLTFPVALGLCCMLAMSLFIWFKLRVVTGMPRSAYAEPETQIVTPPAQPEKQPAPEDAAKNPLPAPAAR